MQLTDFRFNLNVFNYYFFKKSFLPLNILELSQSVTMPVELQYREILPQRSIDDSSFAKGVQNFIFSLGHPTSAIMSKSYLRFEVAQ